MKNPAESMAGTTPTFSVVFSAGPKFVGRAFSSAMPPTAVAVVVDEEHPATRPAAVVNAAADATTRPHLRMRMPVTTEHLTELAADHPCPGRINQCLISRSQISEIEPTCHLGPANSHR